MDLGSAFLALTGASGFARQPSAVCTLQEQNILAAAHRNHNAEQEADSHSLTLMILSSLLQTLPDSIFLCHGIHHFEANMIPSVFTSLLLFDFSAQTNWHIPITHLQRQKLWTIFFIHIPDGYFCFIWMSADKLGA